MLNKSKLVSWAAAQPLWRKGVAVAVVALAAFWFFHEERAASPGATFTVRRGPLEITVLQGGSTEAAEAQEFKCEVRGYQTKVLKIVEEGYAVTEEDVKAGKLLVELDASEIRKQIVQQDIQFESTISGLREAQESYDIQLNQNVSDIQAAEQKTRFARMDFQRFIGEAAAREILEEVGRYQEAMAIAETTELAPRVAIEGPTNRPTSSITLTPAPSNGLALARGATNSSLLTTSAQVPALRIDFSKYKKVEALSDGEAKQKVRKFLDDVQLAEKEYKQAQANLEGTRRLFTNDFVTKTELESDEIRLENARLKFQTAESARDLFLKYEFVKSAEESLSKYTEAARELERTKKGAISKLAQAQAKLKAAEGRYNLELRQRQEFQDQLDKCSIRAKQPGLVVYGGRNRMWYDPSERIREGAVVREQQPILTIPNLSRMSVNVRIHETYIKKVKKGQAVRIAVDAFQDTVLAGEVSKVGLLPDSRNEWLSPDMKVYLTSIDIKGTNDWLKPGMSCMVTILVNKLTNVVYAPIQAIFPEDGKQYTYVTKGSGRQKRAVQVGEFNDEFIVIEKGLNEGEQVALRAPEGSATSQPGSASDKKPAAVESERATPAAKTP